MSINILALISVNVHKDLLDLVALYVCKKALNIPNMYFKLGCNYIFAIKSNKSMQFELFEWWKMHSSKRISAMPMSMLI